MRKKMKEFQCLDCVNIFSISFKSKDPVTYCPFCAESVEELKDHDFDPDVGEYGHDDDFDPDTDI